MFYFSEYLSPIGKITIIDKDGYLFALYFNDKHKLNLDNADFTNKKDTEIIIQTKRWLDIYFAGKIPSFTPKMIYGSSLFQNEVLNILLEIPYGKSSTYGEIAKEICKRLNKKNMSAQAVGNAISHNPISLIIPCHRVLGRDGSLTGYAGGIERKIALLNLEKIPFKMLLEK